jgi:hypothetical protein
VVTQQWYFAAYVGLAAKYEFSDITAALSSERIVVGTYIGASVRTISVTLQNVMYGHVCHNIPVHANDIYIYLSLYAYFFA